MCAFYPLRWDEHVPLATWIHRLEPDDSLLGGSSPYKMVFRREPRNQLDELALTLNDAAFWAGLGLTLTDTCEIPRKIRKSLVQRKATKDHQRNHASAKIGRRSPGAKARVGDQVLLKKEASDLRRDVVHPKLAHNHFTGPRGGREHCSARPKLHRSTPRDAGTAAVDRSALQKTISLQTTAPTACIGR